jgi:2-phosphoglycerate kinase
MKVRIQGQEIPYPLTTLSGRLKLCGLSDTATCQILKDIKQTKLNSEEEIFNYIKDALSREPRIIQRSFDLLNNYDQLRGTSIKIPPLILALEGASATGKSMLAIDFVQYLSITRFISTDTIRQVLRGIYSKVDYPELYCHTYQAYTRRQAGDKNLDPVLRGYIAQCEVISPPVMEMLSRIYLEGASAIIEGVHLEPGSINSLGSGVIEILVNPNPATHRSMFITKYIAGKLRTVSNDASIREEEFLSTRKIQEYMISKALKNNVAIIDLESYENTSSVISTLIINKVEQIIKEHQEEV